jgi:hypothetical protein
MQVALPGLDIRIVEGDNPKPRAAISGPKGMLAFRAELGVQ